MAPTATMPLTWLVARIDSLTAVREPLVPIGIPWLSPDAMLAAPKASSSWSASTVSRCLAANDLAVRIASAKLTRKMATAGSSSEPSCSALREGRPSSGSPLGTGPVRSTPRDSRSSAHESAMPEYHHHEGPGPARSVAAQQDQERQAQDAHRDGRRGWPAPRLEIVSSAARISPSTSLEMPVILEICPRAMSTATPEM